MTIAQGESQEPPARQTCCQSPPPAAGHKKSGEDALRPELKACHAFLDAGDSLVVPSLDRYGRSLQDLIDMVAELRERGIGFTSPHGNLDTTTPGGRLVFCLATRHCTSFTVWGYTDTYSWVPGVFTGQGAATLLDEASRPSPHTRRYGTGSRPVGERSAGRDGRAVRRGEAPRRGSEGQES
ncbi:recombinase family protein [Streptomyces avermitilis]|uniref:recombinase family protein n=1 Tax=Streptomyces avermitilis TaxID=33903 RepID=UPI0037F73624